MKSVDKQWSNACRVGGYATLIVLLGIIADMIIGTVTSGDMSALRESAVDRFNQINDNKWLGLYNLDLLNVVNQLILIPSIFALYVAHRQTAQPMAFLSLLLFICGSILFVSGNSALPMLDLSQQYLAETDESRRLMLAAAGEALLAKGAHGSYGVFAGFALPTIANIMMSWVMVRGKVFGKTSGWIGLAGNILMLVYVMLTTFSDRFDGMAVAIALPGGLLVMTWMILYAIRLFRIKPHTLHS